ncbi:MAG: hypothetical protein P1U40_13235 [Coxiellaceae bacterium]|nr:hypothetical protein [Coxiellaceae bacterium]
MRAQIQQAAIAQVVITAQQLGLRFTELVDLATNYTPAQVSQSTDTERQLFLIGLALLSQIPTKARFTLCATVYQALFNNVERARAHNYRINEIAIIPAARMPKVVFICHKTAFFSNLKSMQQYAAQYGAAIIRSTDNARTLKILQQLKSRYYNSAIEFPGKDISAMLGDSRDPSKEFNKHICFLLGSESNGVDPEILDSDHLDAIIQLPQCGPTVSFNVSDAMIFAHQTYVDVGERMFYAENNPITMLSTPSFESQELAPFGNPAVAYSLEPRATDDPTVIAQLAGTLTKNMIKSLRSQPEPGTEQLFTVRRLLHYVPFQIAIGIYAPIAATKKQERVVVKAFSALIRTFVTFQYFISKVFVVTQDNQPEPVQRWSGRALARAPKISPAFPFPGFLSVVSQQEFADQVAAYGLLLTHITCAKPKEPTLPQQNLTIGSVPFLASAGRHVLFFNDSDTSLAAPAHRQLRSHLYLKSTMAATLAGLASEQQQPPQNLPLFSSSHRR